MTVPIQAPSKGFLTIRALIRVLGRGAWELGFGA